MSTPREFGGVVVVGEIPLPATQYVALLDWMALESVSAGLSYRELGVRWGVSHMTAKRWVEWARSLECSIQVKPVDA